MTELRQTEVFAAWIAGLRDRRAAVIVGRRLDRIANGNFGDVEPVSEGVSELRIHYGPGYRLYFVRQGNRLIVLLCGGDKSTQARDIARALAMAKEV